MDTDVISVNIDRRRFFGGRIEPVTEPAIQFLEEAIGRPAELGEEVLHARALAVIAEHVLVAKDFRDGADDRQDLIRLHERVEADGEMGIGGESAAHTQREADFALTPADTLDCGQADVVNLRIRAPDRAARNRNLELARKIVELGVSREHVGRFEGEPRRIANFVGGNAGDRAAGDVARDVTARPFCEETDLFELINRFGNRFDRQPVELNVLADGKVGAAAGVPLRNSGNGAQLIGAKNAVGDANAEHEIVGGSAFAILAADRAHAIALRVDAPPAEINAGPFGQHGGTALAREFANFLERFPGILAALQTLDALRLRFLLRSRVRLGKA